MKGSKSWIRLVFPILLILYGILYVIYGKGNEVYFQITGIIFTFAFEAFLLFTIIINIQPIQLEMRKINKIFPELSRMDLFELAIKNKFEGSLFLKILITELLILYFSIAGWKTRKTQLPGYRFYYHKLNNYSIFIKIMIIIMMVEITAIHLVLTLAFDKILLAWIITGVSIYSFMWILGDYNAMKAKPMIITENNLTLRIGFRWFVTVPLNMVSETLVLNTNVDFEYEEPYHKIVVMKEPNIMLKLKESVVVRGLFGIKKESSNLAISVESPDLFKQIVKQMMTRLED